MYRRPSKRCLKSLFPPDYYASRHYWYPVQTVWARVMSEGLLESLVLRAADLTLGAAAAAAAAAPTAAPTTPP